MKYSHPVLNSDGIITYVYKSYRCSDTKKWNVLNQALHMNINSLADKIKDDPKVNQITKNKALKLQNEINELQNQKAF